MLQPSSALVPVVSRTRVFLFVLVVCAGLQAEQQPRTSEQELTPVCVGMQAPPEDKRTQEPHDRRFFLCAQIRRRNMDDDHAINNEQQTSDKGMEADAAPKPKSAKPSAAPRRPALKGEDAWKRMNFLYQSAHHMAMLPPRTLGINLSRFYLLNVRKVASKLVLRVDPSVKNSMCKRCGALLLPGHTARTIVVHEETTVAPVDAAAQSTLSAEEAELLREWRQDQQQQKRIQSAQPPAAPCGVEAAPASSSPSTAPFTSRQRRLQRRAQISLAKLAASDPSGPGPQSAPAPVTTPAASAAAPAVIAPSGTVSSSNAAPPTAARASLAPLASALRRRLRRKRRLHVRPTPPHVLSECLLCRTRKRIHTKPPMQRQGGA